VLSRGRSRASAIKNNIQASQAGFGLEELGNIHDANSDLPLPQQRDGRQSVAGAVSTSQAAELVCSADRSSHPGFDDRAAWSGLDEAFTMDGDAKGVMLLRPFVPI
jgi:hypothetical protein